MGIKVANLAKAIACVINYPEATAAVIARFGRDEGLLTTGARGRHVPDATALDCARLLIAMLGTQSPAKANGVIRDFGKLLLCDGCIEYGAESPELAKSIFLPDSRLEDGLAALIQALGRKDVAEQMTAYFKSFGFEYRNVELLPELEIWIDISLLEASITLNDARACYHFDGRQHANEFDLIEDYEEVRTPYSGPVKLTTSVDEQVIWAVAKAFHGEAIAGYWDVADAV
jgi:hypothetical protein